jgi:hypothetical protein
MLGFSCEREENSESPGQLLHIQYSLYVDICDRRRYRKSIGIGKFLEKLEIQLEAPIGVDSSIPTEILHLATNG